MASFCSRSLPCSARDALEIKTAEHQVVVAQADEIASTDISTPLSDRRSILAYLQRQVTYAERCETPLAISMLDLDGFKAVNGQLGYSVGDRVLGGVACGLRDRIRQPEEIGCYGGDEFLLILPSSAALAASEQASLTPHPVGALLSALTRRRTRKPTYADRRYYAPWARRRGLAQALKRDDRPES